MRATLIAAAGVVILCGAAGSADDGAERVARILALPGDAAYGAYLAGDCETCHQGAGAERIPPIAGLDRTRFVSALVAFDLGLRPSDVMQARARSLDDDQMAALAAHYAAAGR